MAQLRFRGEDEDGTSVTRDLARDRIEFKLSKLTQGYTYRFILSSTLPAVTGVYKTVIKNKIYIEDTKSPDVVTIDPATIKKAILVRGMDGGSKSRANRRKSRKSRKGRKTNKRRR